MSGDESPRSRIRAALRALDTYSDLHLILVGDQQLITDELSSASFNHTRLDVVHAEKTIGMDEKPSTALRAKEGSSMWVALEQVADGYAAACVSAGNTGALMAMGRFALKTFVGIDRPAIAASIPSSGGSVLLLDMGANVDCSATNLYQFAIMGSQLAASVRGVASPRVGLLNVGTEDIKGNEQVRLASRLLKEDGRLNYIG
nr:phosphate acyltransferase [Endozoicomonas sp.]